MESSPMLGGTEEFSGTESGWTQYIASSIHEDKADGDHNNAQGDDTDNINDDNDSMASDASSGPSHPELPCGSSEASRQASRPTCHFKHAADEAYGKCSSGKKPYTLVTKKRGEGWIKVEKEPVLKTSSTTSHAQNGAKVRKTK